ncbi:MAG: hypothetical protein ABIK28_18590, partial [Planctomycetota bacterium]
LSYAGLTLFLYLLGAVDSRAGALILLANGFALILSSTVFLGRQARQGMYPLLRKQLYISQVIVLVLVMAF